MSNYTNCTNIQELQKIRSNLEKLQKKIDATSETVPSNITAISREAVTIQNICSKITDHMKTLLVRSRFDSKIDSRIKTLAKKKQRKDRDAYKEELTALKDATEYCYFQLSDGLINECIAINFPNRNNEIKNVSFHQYYYQDQKLQLLFVDGYEIEEINLDCPEISDEDYEYLECIFAKFKFKYISRKMFFTYVLSLFSTFTNQKPFCKEYMRKHNEK